MLVVVEAGFFLVPIVIVDFAEKKIAVLVEVFLGEIGEEFFNLGVN